MPFINTKYSCAITPEQEEKIKSALGAAVSVLGKSESWLMVGFEPECSLYFKGQKSEKIAFVEVSLFGSASPSACDKMTAEVCKILSDELGIPGSQVYVTYHGIRDWGWNGSNF